MLLTVFTGDIVDSSDMTSGQLDEVMSALEEMARRIFGWQGAPENLPGAGFARRGGDGWQIATPETALALRASLFLQSGVKSLDAQYATRIAVAAGEGDLPDGADLNSAHGAAFRTSGRLLDGLSGRGLMAHAEGGALDAGFRLADHIAQGWTRAQARAVHALLPPGSGPRRIAAEALGVTRQAIDQALWSAGFPAIEAALEQIEATP